MKVVDYRGPAMQVKTDPTLIRNLMDYLSQRRDADVERVADNQVVVWLPASARPEMELELRLRGWRPADRSARAELVPA